MKEGVEGEGAGRGGNGGGKGGVGGPRRNAPPGGGAPASLCVPALLPRLWVWDFQLRTAPARNIPHHPPPPPPTRLVIYIHCTVLYCMQRFLPATCLPRPPPRLISFCFFLNAGGTPPPAARRGAPPPRRRRRRVQIGARRRPAAPRRPSPAPRGPSAARPVDTLPGVAAVYVPHPPPTHTRGGCAPPFLSLRFPPRPLPSSSAAVAGGNTRLAHWPRRPPPHSPPRG